MLDSILEAIFKLLGALAPDIARAITGGQSPEDAIAAARAMARKMPERTGPDGTMTRKIDARRRRIRKP